MDPFLYCRDTLRNSRSNFGPALYLLSPDKRRAMTVLYAICRHLDDAVDDCSDKAVALQKLSFFEQELDNTRNQTAKHPAFIALQWVQKETPFDASYFYPMLAGMRRDLEHPSFDDLPDLLSYCYQVASTVGLMTIQICDTPLAAGKHFATRLGHALQLINIIRDLGEDLRRNRLYLPQSLCDKHGVLLRDLENYQHSEALSLLLAELAAEAEAAYQEALAHLPPTYRKNVRIAFLMAAIYFDLLVAIREENFQVLDRKTFLTKSRKIYVSLRCLIRERLW